RWAQRCRDAAMALTMQELAASGRRPVVLLAGNGHVRRDWGVAQLLAVLQPQAKLLAVGVVERGDEAPGAYDRRWLTDPVAGRADPCAGLVMPRR
ncbi:MAG: ChaN family lipoprotein, partial [Rubrivivax sp.]